MSMSPSQRTAHYSRALLALLIVAALPVAFTACSPSDSSEAAIARGCIEASGDNRAKLAASWLSSATVDVEGDRITVRTEVPVGLSVTGKVRFKYWEYRCLRVGDGFQFLGYTVHTRKPAATGGGG